MPDKPNVVFGVGADTSLAESSINKLDRIITVANKKFGTMFSGASYTRKLGLTNKELEIAKQEAKAQAQSNDERKKALSIVRELNDLMKKSSGSTEKKAMEVKAWRKEVSTLEKEYKKISEAGGDTAEIGSQLSVAYQGLNKALDDRKLSGIQKLFNTFKRVGFYRIARRLFQVIEQGLSKGIEGLIAFDSQTNKTMSSITSSVDKINASIALMIMPLAQIAQPIIESLSDGIAIFAEKISMASASMQGLGEYIKIDQEYMRDLQAEANSALAPFDKFNSINATSSPFKKAILTDEDKKKAEGYADIITDLKTLFAGVWEVVKALSKALLEVWEALEPHFPKIIDFLVKAIDWIAKIAVKLIEVLGHGDNLKLLLIGIVGIFAIVKTYSIVNFLIKIAEALTLITATTWKLIGHMTSLVGLVLNVVNLLSTFKSFANFDNLTGWEQFLTILKNIVSVLGIAASLVGIVTGNWVMAGIGIAAGVGGSLIPTYANGGLVDRGSLFVAGEAGAELVTQMPSGQTGVTNISQFKQAMVEAIYECSDVFQNSTGEVVLNLDGATVARSKSFKSELNRTNAGLNLR